VSLFLDTLEKKAVVLELVMYWTYYCIFIYGTNLIRTDIRIVKIQLFYILLLRNDKNSLREINSSSFCFILFKHYIHYILYQNNEFDINK